jgi:hypothetical protein
MSHLGPCGYATVLSPLLRVLHIQARPGMRRGSNSAAAAALAKRPVRLSVVKATL